MGPEGLAEKSRSLDALAKDWGLVPSTPHVGSQSPVTLVPDDLITLFLTESMWVKAWLTPAKQPNEEQSAEARQTVDLTSGCQDKTQ